MERVGLADAMDRKVSDYSKGMRQRTRLAQAVAHDPEIVVADEPLTGLDPIARRQTLELFRGLANEGKSVILSSHVLHEVESLTDTMVLIHRGRLLAQGSVREVRRLINKHPSRVHVKARDPRRLASRLLDEPHVTSVSLWRRRRGAPRRDAGRRARSIGASPPWLARPMRACGAS